MKLEILDELEKEDFLWAQFGGGPDYSVGTSEYGDLVLEALPALIRVARAAEFYCNAETTNGQPQRKAALEEALQQLRSAGTDDKGARALTTPRVPSEPLTT